MQVANKSARRSDFVGTSCESLPAGTRRARAGWCLTISHKGNRHLSSLGRAALEKATASAVCAAQPESDWVALLENREQRAKIGAFWN